VDSEYSLACREFERSGDSGKYFETIGNGSGILAMEKDDKKRLEC